MNADTRAQVDRLRALRPTRDVGDVAEAFLGVRAHNAALVSDFRDSLIQLLEDSDPNDWPDDTLDYYGLIRLPRDEDGEVIAIGDTVYLCGEKRVVTEISFSDGRTLIGLDNDCLARIPRLFTHRPPVTVESVLREFGDEYIRVCETPNPIIGFGNEIIGEEDPEKTIAEYAKRLQLTEVDDDN